MESKASGVCVINGVRRTLQQIQNQEDLDEWMKLKRGIIEKRQQLLDEVELHLKQTQDLNNKLHQLLLQQ